MTRRNTSSYRTPRFDIGGVLFSLLNAPAAFSGDISYANCFRCDETRTQRCVLGATISAYFPTMHSDPPVSVACHSYCTKSPQRPLFGSFSASHLLPSSAKINSRAFRLSTHDSVENLIHVTVVFNFYKRNLNATDSKRRGPVFFLQQQQQQQQQQQLTCGFTGQPVTLIPRQSRGDDGFLLMPPGTGRGAALVRPAPRNLLVRRQRLLEILRYLNCPARYGPMPVGARALLHPRPPGRKLPVPPRAVACPSVSQSACRRGNRNRCSSELPCAAAAAAVVVVSLRRMRRTTLLARLAN
jgi:hypothetical protein